MKNSTPKSAVATLTPRALLAALQTLSQRQATEQAALAPLTRLGRGGGA